MEFTADLAMVQKTIIDTLKHLGELHKEWTEAGVSASKAIKLRHLQEKGYQATSETEISSESSGKPR